MLRQSEVELHRNAPCDCVDNYGEVTECVHARSTEIWIVRHDDVWLQWSGIGDPVVWLQRQSGVETRFRCQLSLPPRVHVYDTALRITEV